MKLSSKIIVAAAWLTFALGVTPAQAATGSFTGAYATNFDGLGTSTAMPLGFRTMVTGTGNGVYTAAIPISTAGIAAATASGTQTLTVWTPPAAAVSSSTALYNCGTPGNTGDRALGSDATSVAAVVIELSLTNNTGSNLLGVVFSYDQKCMTNGSAGTEASELPGYAFFSSIVGNNVAANWTRHEALCLTNSTQGTTISSGNVTITFPTPLTNKGIMYFRWADDNNVASSPDQMIAIDNISITPSANTPPTASLTSPAGNMTVAQGTSLTVSATAADAGGSVTKVEFFYGATKIGETNAAPYSILWTNTSPLGSALLTARATDNDGATTTSAGVTITVVPDIGAGALFFDGVNDYVTFGAATSSLGVSNLTVECWFKRTGTGATTSTGTGGVTAYPLVTKGRGEADGSNVDCNWFLGFDANGKLTADFEDFNNGLNHPITGVGTISSNQWQHAAVTYDVNSGTWVLYLNGLPDATNVIATTGNTRVPRFDSIQHAGLATAMTSAGAAAGFFNGKMDEVRVWNYARPAADILANYQQPIANASGLVGRWSLDETNGTTSANSVAGSANGTMNNGPLFVEGFPFGNPPPVLLPPDAPVLIAPLADETGVTNYPVLNVGVADPNTNALTVTFYARAASTSNVPDFTIVALPDTQFYSQTYPNVFIAQTEWIVSNRATLNIVYVPQLGDCVQNGDHGGDDSEWRNATNAMYRLENPVATLLPQGIPYGIAVGNHDQGATGNGIATDTTTFYNQYFGTNHFLPFNYFGGNYGTNNDNHYDLFSAGGMDFIAIYFEYDTTATDTNSALYAWARNLLQTYPNRRAIVVSHWIMNSGTGGSFGAQGQAIYNALKGYSNLDLMLCGHVNPNGEGRRSDTFNGDTVWTLLSDYQDLANGGNGWLRIYTFSPTNNVIRAKTYSPWLNQYQTGTSSQFEIPYAMTPVDSFQVIGAVTGVPSGSNASVTFPGLAKNTTYEWYATVSDGTFTTTSPTWRFTTGTNAGPVPPAVSITSPTNGAGFVAPAAFTFSASATDLDGVVTNVAFYLGATKLADDDTAPFSYAVSGLGGGTHALRVVATDDSGMSRTSAVVNITVTAPVVTRGPYLQLSTPTSIVIRWRTDIAANSRVIYGTGLGSLNFTNNDPALVTEHIVTLAGLTPDTKYFYAVGTSSTLQNGPDAKLYFTTHPLPGSTKPLHLWVIGDAGTGNASQAAVRDAFYNVNGSRPVDGWLQLGDNAYNSGLDTEFQANMFNIYTNILCNTVTWPTLGNHETAQSTAYVDTYAHFQIFTLPTAGEAGGVPSGTEHYYSFDLGMAHFVCLDSMTANRSTTGAMATWLKADLAANTNRWLIAFWHHPPYTKGSHNSDTETELIQMRQNFNPILEAGGVDLVLSGHSHCYERSYLINGHYGLSTTFTTNMIVQPGSGRETNGIGAYLKPENPTTPPIGNRGAIYSVVGSSGQTSGGSLNHAAHFISLNNLGSMVLDITTNRLDAVFLRETGATNDSFTIIKTNFAPVAQNATYARAPGLSLKINIADLLATKTSDPNSNSVAFSEANGSVQGAILNTNSTFLFYTPTNDNADSFNYIVNDGHGGAANATINVIVVNPGGYSRSITPSNGVVNIQFAGIPGFLYDVQHSTNLVDWAVKDTIAAPPSGLFQFIETNASSPCFYRLMQH
ncbi:MAG: metallophosphoesterase [Verrucomicrobiota bacterium]